MHVVIDIDESTYHRFACGFANEDDAGLIERLFKSGTVLPKCHGRLIDEDKVCDLLYEQEYNYYTELDKVCDTIAEAPTIIEADEEDDND